MRKNSLLLILLCLALILQAQAPEFTNNIVTGILNATPQLVIMTASKAPVVDGYLDTTDPWGTFIPITVRNPGGTTYGMTGQFNILAGTDAFYIAVVVQDATPSSDATKILNSYERDCSEICISMDTVTSPYGAYKTGVWQIRTQREGDILMDGNSGANTLSIATLTNDPKFEAASASSATEYTQELVLPYSALTAGMIPTWDGKYIRFDIDIADNTTGSGGGRSEQLFWYGHNGLGDDHEWDNTRSFGIAMLSTQVSPPSGLTVNPKIVSLSASAGSNSAVNIISSAIWTAISNQTWLTVTPTSGNGNHQLTFTATTNSGFSARTATVTVSSSGLSSQTITITQEAGQVSDTKTVSIPSCGLAAALTQNEKNTIINLTVTGNLCSSDFATMKSMPKLEMLDLSGATVSSPTNWIPASALSNTKLKSIIFPKSITHIDNSAFSGCTGLTSVTIPSTVTCMGTYVFSGCTGLTSVFIPASCTCMGAGDFSGCTGLSTVTTPYFSKYVFTGCDHLTSVIITEGATEIISRSFEGLSDLTSVTIPKSVHEIYDHAFTGCTSLDSLILPATLLYVFESAFSGCTGLTSITIPPKVLTIYKNTFSGCTGLTSITIPASVTEIKDSAFIGCTGLTELTIPATVTSIGKDAFSGCTGLTTVTTPMANDANGISIFKGCDQLKSIIIPDGVKSIKQNDFSGISGITSIIIPESVTSIGDKAFADCSGLDSMVIPLGVNYFGQGVFSGCSSLTFIKIPESITSVGYKAFLNCSNLTSVNLPPSIVSIGYQAFDGCSSLYSINIPASVTYLPTYVFRNCSSLATFEIPALVSSIGQGAFSGCSGLTSIFVNSSVPVDLTNTPDVFTGVDKTNCTLYVPTGSKNAYQRANQWKDFLNIIEGNGFWLSTKAIEFYADYADLTMNIISKHAWSASSDQPWLQLSPTSGNAGETFTISADINPSTIARKAIITISVIGYPDQTIVVTQDGGIVILSVDYNYKLIGKEANSSYTFKVFTNSNITWSAVCNQPWISINPATGTGTDTVTLVAEGNHTKQTRNANITVTVPGVPSQTFTVTQEVGDGTGFEVLSSETINLYPNPVTKGFSISGLKEKATICITDLNGRLLLTKQITGNETIPIHSLPKGVYIVRISTNTGIVERKLVKQ